MPTRETPAHSPVPWLYDGGDILDAHGKLVACLPMDLPAADRRLLMGAPDLLAAVRRWLLRCEAGNDLFQASNYAEIAAIVADIDGGGE